MAHADYECCAVCDSKQDYAEDACAKDVLCTDCLKDLRAAGVYVLDVDEFITWITETDPYEVASVLVRTAYQRSSKGVYFSQCYYRNPVDSAVYQKLLSY
jgi:hypothetical protein